MFRFRPQHKLSYKWVKGPYQPNERHAQHESVLISMGLATLHKCFLYRKICWGFYRHKPLIILDFNYKYPILT